MDGQQSALHTSSSALMIICHADPVPFVLILRVGGHWDGQSRPLTYSGRSMLLVLRPLVMSRMALRSVPRVIVAMLESSLRMMTDLDDLAVRTSEICCCLVASVDEATGSWLRLRCCRSFSFSVSPPAGCYFRVGIAPCRRAFWMRIAAWYEAWRASGVAQGSACPPIRRTLDLPDGPRMCFASAAAVVAGFL